ncbi:hypothetical protein GCM10010520_56900 [Rhizobium viscosum]
MLPVVGSIGIAVKLIENAAPFGIAGGSPCDRCSLRTIFNSAQAWACMIMCIEVRARRLDAVTRAPR